MRYSLKNSNTAERQQAQGQISSPFQYVALEQGEARASAFRARSVDKTLFLRVLFCRCILQQQILFRIFHISLYGASLCILIQLKFVRTYYQKVGLMSILKHKNIKIYYKYLIKTEHLAQIRFVTNVHQISNTWRCFLCFLNILHN